MKPEIEAAVARVEVTLNRDDEPWDPLVADLRTLIAALREAERDAACGRELVNAMKLPSPQPDHHYTAIERAYGQGYYAAWSKFDQHFAAIAKGAGND